MLKKDEPDGQSFAAHYNDMVAGSEAWLETFAQKLNNSMGKEVAKSEVLLGEPRKVIMQLARTWPADLIVMGSHGKRGLNKAFLGSVSDSVGMHAPCSVEIVRIKALSEKKVHYIV